MTVVTSDPVANGDEEIILPLTTTTIIHIFKIIFTIFIYFRTTMPMCDNDTDLYNPRAVHHLRDQGVTGAAYLGIFGRCVNLVWPRL